MRDTPRTFCLQYYLHINCPKRTFYDEWQKKQTCDDLSLKEFSYSNCVSCTSTIAYFMKSWLAWLPLGVAGYRKKLNQSYKYRIKSINLISSANVYNLEKKSKAGHSGTFIRLIKSVARKRLQEPCRISQQPISRPHVRRQNRSNIQSVLESS